MFAGNSREVLYKDELLCRAYSFSGTYAFGRIRIPKSGGWNQASNGTQFSLKVERILHRGDSWHLQERQCLSQNWTLSHRGGGGKTETFFMANVAEKTVSAPLPSYSVSSPSQYRCFCKRKGHVRSRSELQVKGWEQQLSIFVTISINLTPKSHANVMQVCIYLAFWM